MPETIWSARSATANTACTSPVSAPAPTPMITPADPAAGHVGAPDAEERAHEHHALEADVHDARALRRHAAERRERQRRRVAQRGGQQRRPDDDALEVRHARVDRAVGARHADDAGHDGAPADAPLARRAGPPRRAPRRRARARPTGPACAPAGAAARCRTRARRARRPPSRSTRRARRAPAAPRSARPAPPTARPSPRGWSETVLIRRPALPPWTPCAPSPQPPAREHRHQHGRRDEEDDQALDDEREVTSPSCGSKIAGSRLRTEVPLSSAPNSSAAATVPSAVLRPSSATAMP